MTITQTYAIAAIAAILASVLLSACHRNGPEPVAETLPPIVIDTVEEPAPAPQEPAPAPAPQAKKPAARAQPQPKPKTETLYVSSYDAKGPVWGHVTMQGDRGTGTIHDSEENTFTVRCVRRGSELWAYDQNSRHYVFKTTQAVKSEKK